MEPPKPPENNAPADENNDGALVPVLEENLDSAVDRLLLIGTQPQVVPEIAPQNTATLNVDRQVCNSCNGQRLSTSLSITPSQMATAMFQALMRMFTDSSTFLERNPEFFNDVMLRVDSTSSQPTRIPLPHVRNPTAENPPAVLAVNFNQTQTASSSRSQTVVRVESQAPTVQNASVNQANNLVQQMPLNTRQALTPSSNGYQLFGRGQNSTSSTSTNQANRFQQPLTTGSNGYQLFGRRQTPAVASLHHQMLRQDEQNYARVTYINRSRVNSPHVASPSTSQGHQLFGPGQNSARVTSSERERRIERERMMPPIASANSTIYPVGAGNRASTSGTQATSIDPTSTIEDNLARFRNELEKIEQDAMDIEAAQLAEIDTDPESTTWDGSSSSSSSASTTPTSSLNISTAPQLPPPQPRTLRSGQKRQLSSSTNNAAAGNSKKGSNKKPKRY